MRWLLTGVLLFAACGQSDKCFDNAPCAVSQRCDLEQNRCVACQDFEVPYNQIDDDCDPRTDDRDADGDGDVALMLPGGGDCNDSDPTISSLAREVCRDGRDNDCDGDIDELDCGDLTGPVLNFVSPDAGSGIYGDGALVVLEIMDDVGAERVLLFAGQIQVADMPLEPRRSRRVTFSLNAGAFSDGPLNLRAEAYDVAGRQGVASIQLVVDNMLAPSVEFVVPQLDGAYAGQVDVRVRAEDFAGIERVELFLNGTALGERTEAPFDWSVESLPLAEGAHALEARAFDVTGVSQTAFRELVIDRTPPAVVIASPIAQSAVQSQFQLLFDIRDASGVDSVRVGQNWYPGNTRVVTVDTSTFTNGLATFEVEARDRVVRDGQLMSGNSGRAAVQLLVDNPEEPVVILSSPTSGARHFGSVRVEAQVVSPVGEDIEAVEVWINNSRDARRTASPWIFDVPLAASTGTTTVEVRATDVRNRAGSTSRMISVVSGAQLELPVFTPHAGPATELTAGGGHKGGPSWIASSGTPGYIWRIGASGLLVPDQEVGDFDHSVYAELDNDIWGFPELVTSSSATVTVWTLGNPFLQPGPVRVLPAVVDEMKVTNLDGQGYSDLIVRTPEGTYSMSWSGTGLMGWDPIDFSPARALEAEDFDGDGRVEVALGHDDGRVAIWQHNQSWSQVVTATVAGPVHALRVGRRGGQLLVAHANKLSLLRVSAGQGWGVTQLAQLSLDRTPQRVSFGGNRDGRWLHDGVDLYVFDESSLEKLHQFHLPGYDASFFFRYGHLPGDVVVSTDDGFLFAPATGPGEIAAPRTVAVPGHVVDVETAGTGNAGEIAILHQTDRPELTLDRDGSQRNWRLGAGDASDLASTTDGWVATTGQGTIWIEPDGTVTELPNSAADRVVAFANGSVATVQSNLPQAWSRWLSPADLGPVALPVVGITRVEDLFLSKSAGLGVLDGPAAQIVAGLDTVAATSPAPAAPTAVDVFQFNADDRDDLLLTSPAGLQVLVGQAASSSFVNGPSISLPVVPESAIAVDLNDDALPDFVFTTPQRGAWVSIANPSGGWYPPVRLRGVEGVERLVDVELNGDGQQDLVGLRGTQGILRIRGR